MRPLLISLAAATAAPIAVLAACNTVLPPSPEAVAARESALAAEIVAAEETRLAAFRAADRPAFEALVAEELVMVHSDGSVATRADEVANMRVSTPENPLPTLHLEETRVRGYGDAAVLTGALVERRDGRVLLRLRFTNVWARRDGAWRLVSGQLTRAAGG